MKEILTKIFWPILSLFETEEVSPNYKKSYRVILLVVGILFIVLAVASAAFATAYISGEPGVYIPIVVFLMVGLVAIVVGALGSDGAVSKIWGKN